MMEMVEVADEPLEDVLVLDSWLILADQRDALTLRFDHPLRQ